MYLLRYLWLRLRHPGLADFLHQGLGIEERERRCRSHWSRHLQLMRRFQAQALRNRSVERVAILGAGRLLDIDTDALTRCSRRIDLFDADPGCVGAWRSFSLMARKHGVHVQGTLTDLTGSLRDWSARLEDILERYRGISQISEHLAALKPLEGRPLRGYGIILSVNLLSQISIYWRDRVLSALQARNLINADAVDIDPDLAAALSENSAALERAHLNALSGSGATMIILSSDIRFYYYTQNDAHWQHEEALRVSVSPLPLYRLCSEDGWLWHIAPQGIEEKEFGAIHEVHAWAFETA